MSGSASLRPVAISTRRAVQDAATGEADGEARLDLGDVILE